MSKALPKIQSNIYVKEVKITALTEVEAVEKAKLFEQFSQMTGVVFLINCMEKLRKTPTLLIKSFFGALPTD
jgi:hypothetical protein